MGRWKGTPTGKRMAQVIAAEKAREVAAGREQRKKRIANASEASRAAYAASIARRQRERFYIELRYPAQSDGEGGWIYPRAVWPVLFKTRDLAEDAMALLPVFANREATTGRPRIKTATIVKTRIA